MTTTSDDETNYASLALARWLASPALAGCYFVSGFASEKVPSRLRYNEFREATMDPQRLEEIDGFLEACGSLQRAGVMVFPSVRTTRALVDLCVSIACGPRWRMQVKQDSRGTLVSLDWHAACGLWSNAMGFAPLFSMPATRRAPYVTIALWPGEPRMDGKGKGLSFNDMPSHQEQEAHDRLVTRTRALSTTLFGEKPKDAPWRNTTFAVEHEFASLLPGQ